MCANGTCGGGCGDAPRFTQQLTTGVRPRVVGTAAGPDLLPDHLITPAGGMLTYEALYAGLGPNGEPAALAVPGTYGAHATRAGRR